MQPMTGYTTVSNAATGAILLDRARRATNFWQHLVGLMFAAPLADDEGVLFVYGRDSRADTTIHMFFMRYDLGVVWINDAGEVVDAQYAKRWRPYYAPAHPARYFIEANPSILDRVRVGDHVTFADRP